MDNWEKYISAKRIVAEYENRHEVKTIKRGQKGVVIGKSRASSHNYINIPCLVVSPFDQDLTHAHSVVVRCPYSGLEQHVSLKDISFKKEDFKDLELELKETTPVTRSNVSPDAGAIGTYNIPNIMATDFPIWELSSF